MTENINMKVILRECGSLEKIFKMEFISVLLYINTHKTAHLCLIPVP